MKPLIIGIEQKTRNIKRNGTDCQHNGLYYMANKKQIAALRLTIKWFKKQIKPRDCGWMYTTIDGLKYRIEQLKKGGK